MTSASPTVEDAEIVRMWRSGMTMREIGATVGLVHSAVHRQLVRLGEPTDLGRRPPAWVGKAQQMRRDGVSYDAIAFAVGRTKSNVWYRLNQPSRTSLILAGQADGADAQ